MTKYLEDIIPASQRRRVYAILGLLCTVATVAQAACQEENLTLPTWARVGLNVLTMLSAGGFLVSHANTKPVDDPEIPWAKK